MATPYSNIFKRFLQKIYDIDLASSLISNTALAESQMIGYMVSAIESYPQCTVDLTNRDDTTQQFNQTLFSYDEEILSMFMISSYISPYIVSIFNLQPYLQDSEFRLESTRLGLGNKLALQKQYEDKAETLISKHSYASMDYTQFN